MSLDIRTLILVLGLTHVLQFAVFIHQYRVNRTLRGVGWWLLWSGVEVLAFAFMLLRGLPALQTTAILAQNGLLILGVMFFYIGILRFYDRQENRRLLLSIFSAYMAGLCYFLFGQDDFNARGVLISGTLALFAFLSARALLVNKTRPTAASANLLAAACIIHGSHFAFRFVVQLAAPPPADFFAPTLFNSTALLDAIIVGLLWTFGTTLLISQRLNAEMKEAKEEMDLVFNISPDAAVISRLSDGLIVNVNDGFETLTGWNREACIGKTTLAVHVWKNPADRESVVRELHEKGCCRNHAAEFQRKDGSELFGLMSAAVFELHDLPHVISLIRDITERARNESSLHMSEAKYRRLIENSHDIIYTLTAEGIFQFVSPAWTALLGHPVDQVVGQPFHPFVHPDDLPGCMVFLKSVIEKGQQLSGAEYRVRHADGSWRWHASSAVPLRDKTGTVIGLEGTASDVTLQKQSKDRIRVLLDEANRSRRAMLGIIEDEARSKADLERLAMAINQAAESVVVTDAQGLIQYVNPAFERVAGYTRQEALGQNPRILKSGKHDAEFYRRMWATLAAGQSWSGHFVNKRKDGTLYEEEATLSPVFDRTGKVVNYVAVKRDVTHEVQLHAQLQQAQKMESVGRLAGGVAHDFNNLLTAILGYAEMSRDRIEPGHPIREYLAEIINGAKRSAEITRQLLAFARKQTIAPKILDLNDVVGGMLKLLQRMIGEDIKLAWRPGMDVRPVKLDPSQVDQILANLCVNARDAIAGIGEITVETGNIAVDADHCARHPEAIPGTYVFLAVSDDGCGMDKATLAQVFEPFFTTKGVGKGTGLGLATVYGIARQNNGFIEATSEPGKGTTFRIYFPQVESDTMRTQAAATAEAPKGRGETVLLVEDEVSVGGLCRLILEALDYSVLVAETPGEALEIATRHPGDIRVLLTDVVMPEMDGRQLAKRICAVKPGVKVLFMSGYTADVIAQRGVLDAGVQFLAKPFTREDLACKVRQVLEGE